MELEMLFHSAEFEAKRSKRVILWSGIYLAASWFNALFTTNPTDPEKIRTSDLLGLISTPFMIAASIIVWLWVRSLIITSRVIQPEGFGYRQGWAFWGWVAPVFSWWVPKRLIDNTYLIFSEFSNRAQNQSTKRWWTFFVLQSVIQTFGFVGGSSSIYRGISIASAILLTLAYKPWIRVVEETSLAHQAALKKLADLN